ncbi:geobacillin-26 family protein [Exiguobacterium sp. s150]|uniref:geobacillin-26 family protein n=1 Tax=Exiguobacterium sp. s150 TaxID=2751221 RepID=UPI001BECB665|nr:geobacillin-26 family protein [Exiguobacterium sp. s150]
MNKKTVFTLTLSSILLLNSTATLANASTLGTIKPNLSTETIANEDQNSKSDIVILKDDKIQKIVKEITSDVITIATNNKVENVLTIEKYDVSNDSLISTEVINLNEIQSLNQQTNKLSPEMKASSVNKSYQYTFTDREYEIYFFDSGRVNWQIRSDDRRKSVSENSGNRTNLKNFRAAVERVNSSELAVISAAGVTTAASLITVFMTGGLAAGLALTTGGGAVATAMVTMNSAVTDADYYFNRVK